MYETADTLHVMLEYGLLFSSFTHGNMAHSTYILCYGAQLSINIYCVLRYMYFYLNRVKWTLKKDSGHCHFLQIEETNLGSSFCSVRCVIIICHFILSSFSLEIFAILVLLLSALTLSS